MRDRLIKILNEIHPQLRAAGCSAGAKIRFASDLINKYGVIVPPCKVGDTVYRLAHNTDKKEYRVADFWEVVEIVIYEDEIGIIDDSDNYFTVDDIGKTVFFTKEEAERALAERKGKQ